jgi:hypothetical protein
MAGCVLPFSHMHVHDASMIDPMACSMAFAISCGQGNYFGWWNPEPAGVEGTERTLHSSSMQLNQQLLRIL